MSTKIKKAKVNNGVEKLSISAIENEFNLQELISFGYGGNNVGAYLLKKNDIFQVVFGFQCSGITNTMPQTEVDKFYDPVEIGLKDFPDGENLTLHYSLMVDASKRRAELQNIRSKAASTELKYFLMGEEKNTIYLSDKKIRKEVDLTLYTTYTFSPSGKKSNDYIEKVLQRLEQYWIGFTGNKEVSENLKLKKLLEEAYENGWERWRNYLASKLSLEIKPLGHEVIWNKLVARFGTKKIKPPQVIHLDETGLSLEKNSDLNAISKIFAQNEVPVANKEWVSCRGKYTGVMSLLDKPEAMKDKRTMLQYMWKIMSRQEVYDTEIICQMTRGNVRAVREAMQSVTKQAQTDGEIAARGNNIDVAAQLKQKKAIKAQEALYEDNIPFDVATVFLIHRDTAKEVKLACNQLESQFQSPLELFRECTYAFTTWLQTFPINMDRVLNTPFKRTSVYLNSEISVLMPLVFPNSKDKKGIEFLSSEGGVPIYLDLWSRLRHILILATNRGGKGIMLARIVMHHLARGVPVSILDYPRPDGTSTFSEFAKFLGEDAEYFNVKNEKTNIFEIPDLSRFPQAVRDERFQDFKEFLLDILETMVVGTKERQGINPDTVKSILNSALEQFYSKENLGIHNRFTEAFLAGRGTPEWQRTPVLKDFIKELGAERLQITNATDDILRHIAFIKLRLNHWLTTRVGQAISAPSTINASSRLIVYALANLNNEEDAAIMCLAVNMQALRKSMEYDESVILVDEISILIRFEAIAKMVSRFCANGLKSGIQMILSGQDVNSIAQSPYGSQILENTPVNLIGRVEPKALKSLEEELGLEKEIVGRNASKAFQLVPQYLASSWLITADGVTNDAKCYIDPYILASAANNTDEVRERNRIAKEHDDKFAAMTAFALFNAELKKNPRS